MKGVMMDKGQVIAEAVKVLRWADGLLDSTAGEYSVGYDSGFRRGVQHLAEFLLAGTGMDTNWDALVAGTEGAARV